MSSAPDFKTRLDQVVAELVSSRAGSGDRLAEVQARLFATGIFETFAAWVMAEGDADTPPSATMSTTAHIIVGMAALTLSHPDVVHYQREVADLIAQEFRKGLVELAGKIQARVKAAARSRR
jgi:hypothetical protein